MNTIVVKPPITVSVFPPLSKNKNKLREIRNFRDSTMPFMCPKTRLKMNYQYHRQDPKIYPDKFLERNREVKNSAYVEGNETKYRDGNDVAILHANVSAEAYEYDDDLCAFHKSEEESMCIKHNFIARLKLDFHNKLRADIVEWVIQAHRVLKFPTEALYLAISLFDRFLAIHPMEKKKAGLVGVTALQLAVKYAGIRESIPSVRLFSDLVLTSCPVKKISCSVKQILEMEILMLNTLQYKLSILTPSTYISKFLQETQSNDKEMLEVDGDFPSESEERQVCVQEVQHKNIRLGC